MAFGISHTIGVLVRGHNQLTKVLVQAEDSLVSLRKTALTTAGAINRGFEPPDIDTRQIRKASGHLTTAGAKALVFGGLMSAGLGLAVSQATHFNTAMAEVSTLVDTSATDVSALSSTVRGLSREFGEAPISTAKALYTTISAGFGEAKDATTLLTGALKLSKGGLADLGVSIDGLTSILNSYGFSAERTTFVSDRMFTAMRLGKTTIGELSSSLGAVTPLAAATGVSLDELLSAVSALTLGGLGTAEAVTSIRGILTAVTKQTAEARDISHQLGLEFDTSAIKAKGFSNWLAEVGAKTQGNQQQMAGLFGRVEALNGALALTGTQAGNFNNILGQMHTATGATETAFGKIRHTAAATFAKMSANISILREIIGNALLPTVRGLAAGIGTIAGRLSKFAEAHPLLTRIGVTVAAVATGVTILGGAALIAGGQIMLAMALINVSTGGLLLTVGAIVTGISTLVLWLTRTTDAADESGGLLSRTWKYIKDGFFAMAEPIAFGVGVLAGSIIRSWNAVRAFTAQAWPHIAKILSVVWKGISVLLAPGMAALTFMFRTGWGIITTLTSGAWQAIGQTLFSAWNGIAAVISAGWNIITGVVLAGLRLLTGDWDGAWDSIENRAQAAWNNLKGFGLGWLRWMQGLGSVFRDIGSGLIESFQTGLESAWKRLESGFTTLLSGLRELLPGSDAKRGPLSTLTAAGKALLPTFSDGILAHQSAPQQALARVLKPSAKLLGNSVAPPRPFRAELPVNRAALTRVYEDHSRQLVIERGAIVIQASNDSIGQELERQLESLLARLNDKWGPIS